MKLRWALPLSAVIGLVMGITSLISGIGMRGPARIPLLNFGGCVIIYVALAWVFVNRMPHATKAQHIWRIAAFTLIGLLFHYFGVMVLFIFALM